MVSENTFLRILLAIVAVIVLIPLLMMAFMMPMMGMMESGHMADGTMMNSGSGIWMWLFMLLVPIAIAGGIGYLLYRVFHQSGDVVSDPALEELRTAYARGELSDEEFESRRSRLQSEE